MYHRELTVQYNDELMTDIYSGIYSLIFPHTNFFSQIILFGHIWEYFQQWKYIFRAMKVERDFQQTILF